jgi:tetratricopeptide (TPR) repeat protein
MGHSCARIRVWNHGDGGEVEEEAKKPWDAGVHAMRKSLDLAKEGQPQEALRILDEAIEQATEEKRGRWIVTLCRHATVLANTMGDIRRETKYAEQALPHADDYRFACYNFAQLLLRGGDVSRAERYAREAHKLALAQGTEADRDLIAAIRQQWPNLSDNF